MVKVLAEMTDISVAEQAEKDAPPGMLEVRFYTTEALTQEANQQIFDTLYDSGVDVRRVYTRKAGGLYYTAVVYNKLPVSTQSISALPVAIIPLVAFGMIAVLIGIGIFKFEAITQSIGKLLLITFGGTIVIAALLRKPIERAMTR